MLALLHLNIFEIEFQILLQNRTEQIKNKSRIPIIPYSFLKALLLIFLFSKHNNQKRQQQHQQFIVSLT